MRTARLFLAAGLLVACGKAITIAPDDAAAPTGDGGTSADATVLGDGGAPGAPCDGPGLCLLANTTGAASIAVQGEYVYYTLYVADGAIWRVPRAGGPAEVAVAAQNLPSSLFATADALYWVNEGSHSVARRLAAPPNSGATITSGSSLGGGQIAAFGSNVFWTAPGAVGTTDAGEVHYSSAWPSDQTMLMGLAQPTAIAADATHVYFSVKTVDGTKEVILRSVPPGSIPEQSGESFMGIRALAVSSTGAVAVAAADRAAQAASFDGGFVPAFAPTVGGASAVGVVIDEAATATYFLSSDGAVHRFNGAAGGAEIRVAGCTTGRAIAHDVNHLYLACETSIWRVPK
jgi:hypothetical protein